VDRIDSIFDVDVVGDRAGLAAEYEALRQICRFEDFARVHLDSSGHHGGDAGTAVTFAAGVWWVDPGIEHCVDQGFVARPLKAVTGAVQIDLYGGIDPSAACFGV
jgi:hypothetical protein